MIKQGVSSGTGRQFYGWTALAGTSLQQITGAGAYIFTFGIFLPVISTEMGWDRAALSWAMSLGILCFGLPGPLMGITIAKYGPRIHIILGNLIVALGLLGVFFVKEIWQVYVLYCVMGIGSGAAHFLAGNTVANNWFLKKRPLAMGILASALGVAGFIFPPVTTALISAFGWRVAFLVLAGIVLIGGALVSGVILVRNRPEDMGQFPDGIRSDSPSEVVKKEEPVVWTAGQAMRSSTFWIILVFLGSNVFGFGIMLAHQAAYMEDLGFSAILAATTVSVVSVTNIIGMLGFGVLALKYNMRNLICASIALMLVSMVVLLVTRDLGLIFLYALLFGVGSGALATAETTIISVYYGRASFTRVMGAMVLFLMIIEAVGPVVAGSIYVATTSYTVSFIIIAVFFLVGGIFAFFVRPPKASRLKGTDKVPETQ